MSSPFIQSVKRFCKRNYAFDYIGLAVLVTGYTLTEIFGEPFHRLFRLDDPAIQYPHAEVERISLLWLLIYSIAVPFVAILVYLLISRASANKMQASLLGLSIALMLTSFVTNVIKNAVGRPRPDLLSRCKPKPGTPTDVLVSIDVCTETRHHTLHDGWRSFPSGHSSFAWSGLGYLTLFFAGQFHVFRPHNNLIQVFITLIPVIGAALIAISRLEDYRHDPVDVTTGSVIGFLFAYFCYRRYYPAWRSSRCHVPHEFLSENHTGDLEGGARPSTRNFELAGDESDDDLPLHQS